MLVPKVGPVLIADLYWTRDVAIKYVPVMGPLTTCTMCSCGTHTLLQNWPWPVSIFVLTYPE